MSLCARFQDGHWVSSLGWDVEVPAYSGGNRWVGVVALGAPPPVPTLMQLARRSNLQKDLERVRLRGTRPPVDSSRDLSSNTLQVANWSEALAVTLGDAGLRELRELQQALDDLVSEVNSASRERRKAQRDLRRSRQEQNETLKSDAVVRLNNAKKRYADGRRQTAMNLTRLERLVSEAAKLLYGTDEF